MIKIHKKICLPPPVFGHPPRLAFPPGYFGQFANPPGWGLLKFDYPPRSTGGGRHYVDALGRRVGKCPVESTKACLGQ